MSRSKVFVLGLVVACACLASRPVWAQAVPTAPPPPAKPTADQAPEEPSTNLTFGYQYMYDGSWSEHLLLGYFASITHRIKPTLALVGEAGGSNGKYKTTNFRIERYAFLGGLRLMGGEGEVRPFFQVLAGYSRQGGDVGIANGIAVQPGGGADLVVTESLTIRAQADYRFLREDGHNYNQYRLSGGLIWYLGKKAK